MGKDTRFLISTSTDFPDDCGSIVFTPELLGQLLDRFQWLGVGRLNWNYYSAGMWEDFARSPATRATLDNLGEPMSLACHLAHERGMEFCAVIKPYETGHSHAIPASSQSEGGLPGLPCIGGVYSRLDRWILERPEARVRARAGDVPTNLDKIPITRIQLRQKDMFPVRFAPEDLEIWTSADNNGYHKRDVSFTVREEVATCPRDVVDVLGNPVTRKGESIRVLNLVGLDLLDPFVAVTTRLGDETGSFRNTAIEMVRAFGPDDQLLPIVVASHKSVWDSPRDLRTDCLAYDAGIGDINVCLDMTNERPVCAHCHERGKTDCMQAPIFPETPVCRDGVIAFARGRNEYLPGTPCEAVPEVQAWWLSWVDECLAAGVDGMDVRISNHASWTDCPELYGFNESVRAEYQRRHGVDPEVEPYDPALIGALRGEIYDGFLRAMKQRLSDAGKWLQLHLEVESFRPDAAQARRRTRPGNITFDWRGWLRDGLADEATLMGVNWGPERVLNDAVGQEMLDEAAAAGILVHFRHFVARSRDGKTNADEVEYGYRFGKLSGYNLYETAAFYDHQQLGADGQLQFHPGLLEQIRDRLVKLGLV